MPRFTLTKERVLSAFVNQMIADKGLTTLGQPEKTKLKAKILDELNSQLERAIIAALPDEKLAQLSDLLDADTKVTDEQIEGIFRGHEEKYEIVVAQTMKAFRMEFLGGGR